MSCTLSGWWVYSSSSSYSELFWNCAFRYSPSLNCLNAIIHLYLLHLCLLFICVCLCVRDRETDKNMHTRLSAQQHSAFAFSCFPSKWLFLWNPRTFISPFSFAFLQKALLMTCSALGNGVKHNDMPEKPYITQKKIEKISTSLCAKDSARKANELCLFLPSTSIIRSQKQSKHLVLILASHNTEVCLHARADMHCSFIDPTVR